MTAFIFPFLQRFAEIVRGLQDQLFADIRLCAGDSALLLTEHHTRPIEHLFLENQQVYFLFGGSQLRKKTFPFRAYRPLVKQAIPLHW